MREVRRALRVPAADVGSAADRLRKVRRPDRARDLGGRLHPQRRRLVQGPVLEEARLGRQGVAMALVLDGKAVAAKVRAEVAAEAAELKSRGVTPGLAVVLVGEDPA